jgi:DNA-binding transcriptional LysR family regulator
VGLEYAKDGRERKPRHLRFGATPTIRPRLPTLFQRFTSTHKGDSLTISFFIEIVRPTDDKVYWKNILNL